MEIAKLQKYMMSTYKKKICLVKGIGSIVYDINEKKYLDLTGAVATCSIGHTNPEILKVILDQAEKMINPSNIFYSIPQLQLGKKLADVSGLKKCFFTNSGTEATEAAIKLIRKHRKGKIIAMKNAFHGRTYGSLSLTWSQKYKEKFTPLLPGIQHVEYDNLDYLSKAIDKDTAAVILEPIQGEAGVIVPKKGYLSKVAELCSRNKIYLIIDEIQTGCGRTGKFFSYQHEGILPDIVLVSKGIANGYPLGVAISKELDFELGEHGSTFGGNSLGCAVALKTIEIIEKMIPFIEEKGNYFMNELKKINGIKEVRGKGLMIGIAIENANSITEKCAENGLLINCINENILRILPALTITMEEIDSALKILKKVMNDD